ncbi:MAG: PIN domain-containing protein [Spirochaetes bacterium]|nr:PIN domain-containing protein [Spirochaetota bacterium]
MKKTLIDTNVVLDYMLHRPGYSNAMIIYLLAEQNLIDGYVPASAITDIFYIVQKQLGKKPAKDALKNLLSVFKPATVTDSNIYHALGLDWADFEDSVQYTVGKSFSADYIITRNTRDFSSGSIPAVTPEQFIQIASGI